MVQLYNGILPSKKIGTYMPQYGWISKPLYKVKEAKCKGYVLDVWYSGKGKTIMPRYHFKPRWVGRNLSAGVKMLQNWLWCYLTKSVNLLNINELLFYVLRDNCNIQTLFRPDSNILTLKRHFKIVKGIWLWTRWYQKNYLNS